VGGAFWLAKAKTGPHGLSFGPICANKSANPRGNVCGGVGVLVEAVVHRFGPIKRGASFGWQNRKPSCTGSVSVGGVQMTRGAAKEVCREG
jgi:hypothetical protein